jgi:hypothetical protein
MAQSKGIEIHGISHNNKLLRLRLLLMKIRKPTTGIKVNAGIFVNMAKPRNIPEIRGNQKSFEWLLGTV